MALLTSSRRNATWVFLGCVTAFTISNTMAFYIFIRRAANQGYIPVSHGHYEWNIFNPRNFLKNLDLFGARNDFLGLLTFNIALASLSLALITPSNAGFGNWRNTFFAVSLIIWCMFVVWELYLGGNFRGTLREDAGSTESTKTFSSVSGPSDLVLAPYPFTAPGEDLDAQAAQTAARLKGKYEPEPFRKRCRALIPGSLVRNHQALVCTLCLFLESFAYTSSCWVVFRAPMSGVKTEWQYWLYCVCPPNSFHCKR